MASPNTLLLHVNLSHFSCQGAQICSHSAFPPGKRLLGLETKFGIRTGNPEIDEVLGTTELPPAAGGPNALSSKTRQPQRTNTALKRPVCQQTYALNSGLLSSK